MNDRYARKIAARGLTPNDRGKLFSWDGNAPTGMVINFEHTDVSTRITYLVNDNHVTEAFGHLEVITVYDR